MSTQFGLTCLKTSNAKNRENIPGSDRDPSRVCYTCKKLLHSIFQYKIRSKDRQLNRTWSQPVPGRVDRLCPPPWCRDTFFQIFLLHQYGRTGEKSTAVPHADARSGVSMRYFSPRYWQKDRPPSRLVRAGLRTSSYHFQTEPVRRIARRLEPVPSIFLKNI